jgi:hypothetical protein
MYASRIGHDNPQDHAEQEAFESSRPGDLKSGPSGTLKFDASLQGLDRDEWLNSVADIVDEDGYVQRLGDRHFSTFLEDTRTLLVTFETLQGIEALSDKSHPLGWEMVKHHRWSHLSVISDGDTWFRDKAVFAYFDRLSDDGFFDDFDRVVFYGAGSCGYAAAAFSVAAPGADVLVVQPQATLDPEVAEWDTRFAGMRRVDFTDRYGYAPDMLDAAHHAYVVYDPYQPEDAMHAALFSKPNVTKLRVRHMGAALQTDLLNMGVLFDLLSLTREGRLDPVKFARSMRKRRGYLPYLRRLLIRLDQADRTHLMQCLCENVVRRLNAPRFERKLDALQKAS